MLFVDLLFKFLLYIFFKEEKMNQTFKNVIRIGFSIILIFVIIYVTLNRQLHRYSSDNFLNKHTVKNVIMMVPDGCSNSLQTLARWKKEDALIIDSLLVGGVKTYMANSVITGSAAAVTAFATGHKTTGYFLGVGPRADDVLVSFQHPGPEMEYRPLATVLEGARLHGKATGLVATSNINHPTPAGFASHVDSRYKKNEITEQMIYQNIDVALGGGMQDFLPESQGGKRTDGEDLLNVLREKGYQIVETTEEMEAVTSGKIWGIFADDHMDADLNRSTFQLDQPSLAEMTSKAIQLLSQDKDGFFLMVEGSQIDWAGHDNDPIYMVTDFLAFDEAVEVAVNFAREDKRTLVLVFPDHNTGGLSIGSWTTDIPYNKTKIEDLIAPLERMKVTAGAITHNLGDDHSYPNLSREISKWWGIDIARNDYEEIMILKREIARRNNTVDSLARAISRVISKNYTVLAWTTDNHTGTDVPLWAYGPGRPVGLYDNTDLAKITAAALGLDLEETNKELFVEAGEVFSNYNLDKSDTANPVLRIGTFELPINKNILMAGDEVHELKGIVVYAPMTEKVYIPMDAVQIIKSGE
jgi:alkaline phosphatase